MIREPRTEFVSRGVILNCGAGVTKGALRKALAAGCLTPVRWPGMKHARFAWVQVRAVFGIENGKG